MKALTLRQPWASLVALGVKTIETRSWSTRYRGRLLIHAGARPIGTGALYLGDGKTGWTNVTGEPIANGEQAMSGGIDRLLVCPLGAIVASCELVDVVPMVDGLVSGTGVTWDIEPGRYAWLLDDIQPTTERCPWCRGRGSWPPLTRQVCRVCAARRGCDPIPAKGRQGLWNWTP